ncbi:helix-turn-helix transcriptional regulator [Ekhidna sp.]|uniref:helix-turn-helix domain-containing protein n=1 Tax=Ekhidna sp. TaxID=2608089 RepID=UPI0032988097
MIIGGLASKVKEARTAKGLSQDALADTSNISLRTIQRIEKGLIPRTSTLKILCDVLELDFNEFVNPSQEVDIRWEIQIIKRMNLSILLLLIIPFANLIVPFLIWKLSKKLATLKSNAGKVISFQIIWTLSSIFIFFGSVFISNLISGTAGDGHYWAFIALIICLIWNISVVSKSTRHIVDEDADFLPKTPDFF